ncbi:MAG: electron transport complex subunit E [Candidatus Eisenbacteria bacterium]
MSLGREFTKGLYSEMPVFRIVLGVCPTLAVSTALKNGVGMGIAATFVLVGSNVFVSLIRGVIPPKIRIPCYIVVIASFVTIVDLVMAGYTPELHKNLGIFIPLIVVNCIILGRAEAFAGKNGVVASLMDGLGMGIGFTFALSIVSTIREIIGSGKIWNLVVLGQHYNPVLAVVLAPGAFITLGLVIGFFNLLDIRRRGQG